MKMILLVLIFSLVSSCVTGELTTLGLDHVTIQKGEQITEIYHRRNIFAYPAIILFYVPALCVDFVLVPYYIFNFLSGFSFSGHRP